MSRGYITLAQNSARGDYLRAAYGLALSLKKTQSKTSNLTVMITPGMDVPDEYRAVFDQVIEIPWGDMARNAEWKIHNKWKVYHCSPYEETILLDADMLLGADIEPWWNILGRRSIFSCATPYTFRGDPIRNSIYREAFDRTKIPHVYTAFFYFRKNAESLKYFYTLEEVYKYWNQLCGEFSHLPTLISGDLAFGMAMKLSGMEHLYVGEGFPGIVHMKSQLQEIGENVFEDWTQHLGTQVRRDGSIFVGGYRQMRPFHYHIKTFLTDQIIERLSHGE